MSVYGWDSGVPAGAHTLARMDAAAAIERQTRRNRVRRGRRSDGLLVAIGDADPAIGYACPVCGDALIQKTSCNEKPFFAHVGGEGTCSDDAVRHAAAVRILGELVDHAVAGRLALTISGRCRAGRHRVDQSLDVRPGDIVHREEHGVAVHRDGGVTCVLVIHRPHGDAPGSDQATFEIDPVDALGWDADEALERCGSGGRATLVLAATVVGGVVPCAACDQDQEVEQRRTDKAAAVAARERVECCREFAEEIEHGRRRFETGFCPKHPDLRLTIDIGAIGKFYDGMSIDCRTSDGERWDVALTRGRELALGILLVGPDSMRNEANPDHRCRNPGRAHFVAVPIGAEVDPASGAWPTNAWHLKSPGRCPRCDLLPCLMEQIGVEEVAFATRFEAGRREVRPADIRSTFAAQVDERLPWYPAAIEADVDAATSAAIERLVAAAALVWPPERAEARRALENKDLTASVDRIAAAYAKKNLMAGQSPRSAAEIHQSIHWRMDRPDGLSAPDQAAVADHIAAVIDRLVHQAWALWPGHEARAKVRRQLRRDEEGFGLRRRWGRRPGW